MPLSDFEATPRSTMCWTCRLPTDVRSELERGWEKGIRFAQMIRYLTGAPPQGAGFKDKDVRILSLQNHFYRGHYAR